MNRKLPSSLCFLGNVLYGQGQAKTNHVPTSSL